MLAPSKKACNFIVAEGAQKISAIVKTRSGEAPETTNVKKR